MGGPLKDKAMIASIGCGRTVLDYILPANYDFFSRPLFPPKDSNDNAGLAKGNSGSVSNCRSYHSSCSVRCTRNQTFPWRFIALLHGAASYNVRDLVLRIWTVNHGRSADNV